MFGKYNPGDWSLTPELQKKFEEVQAQTRRLQAEFGITPMTLEERAAAYQNAKLKKLGPNRCWAKDVLPLAGKCKYT